MTFTEKGRATQAPLPDIEATSAAISDAEIRAAKKWLMDRIQRGRGGNLICETALLTPALAQVLLAEHNTRNRSLNAANVEKHTRIITSGQWLVSSQGISVATDGVLNNGQHRCRAVVECGISVPVLLVFGEDVRAFTMIDDFKPRSAADVATISGEQNGSGLAAAARQLRMVGRPRSQARFTHAEILETIAANPALRVSVTAGHRFASNIKRSSAAGGALAHFLIGKQSPAAYRLDAFWDKVCTGADLKNVRDPILTLRRQLSNQTLNIKRGNSAPHIAAAIIITWNLWVRNKQTVSVSWKDGEAFPVPV